jgi:hypothetical protein
VRLPSRSHWHIDLSLSNVPVMTDCESAVQTQLVTGSSNRSSFLTRAPVCSIISDEDMVSGPIGTYLGVPDPGRVIPATRHDHPVVGAPGNVGNGSDLVCLDPDQYLERSDIPDNDILVQPAACQAGSIVREENLPELVAVLIQLGKDLAGEVVSVADMIRVERRRRRVRVVQAVHDLVFLDVLEQCRQTMLGQHDRRRDAS